MSLPTLYKMDSKGKIRSWSVTTQGTTYSVSHGLLNGAQQETLVTCEGKNIGRSNETTAEAQAISEAQGLWNKQKNRKGYTEEIPTEQPDMPMLAHKYVKFKKKVKFPCVVSPKINGIRLSLAVQGGKVTTKSRTNNEFTGLENTIGEFNAFADIELDGELYSRSLTFEQLGSTIRKGDINDPRMESVFFYAFDIMNDETYHQRVIRLESLIAPLKRAEIVPWYIVNSHEEIEAKHKEFVDSGFEGTMIRNLNSAYQKNVRSYDLLKYKNFIDEEFEVVGWSTGKGKFENVPTFVLKCEAGEFEATPEGDQELREFYLANADSYIGSFATVRFFEYTSKGIPYLPVLVDFRSDGI
jgi:DNA ligase-1